MKLKVVFLRVWMYLTWSWNGGSVVERARLAVGFICASQSGAKHLIECWTALHVAIKIIEPGAYNQ